MNSDSFAEIRGSIIKIFYFPNYQLEICLEFSEILEQLVELRIRHKYSHNSLISTFESDRLGEKK